MVLVLHILSRPYFEIIEKGGSLKGLPPFYASFAIHAIPALSRRNRSPT